MPDTDAHFFISNTDPVLTQAAGRERALVDLQKSWYRYSERQLIPEDEWLEGLSQFLDNLVSLRIAHVREWMASNLTRFQAAHASVVELRRTFDSTIIDLKSSLQLCKMRCASCQLVCIQNMRHDGYHDCQTNHICTHTCDFCNELQEESKQCSIT